ncbi:MAG: DUF2240 family protein [Candidatus Thermoplasmatota archaeon]
MATEEKNIIAFLFKRSGKEKLEVSEFYLPMSMELKWCKPQQAKKFVQNSLEKNLLEKEKGLLKPGFDIEKVDIPVGFQPSDGFFETSNRENKEESENSFLDSVINKISEKSDEKTEVLRSEIKAYANKKNIFPEVAALIKAKEYKVSIKEFEESLEKLIFKENKE